MSRCKIRYLLLLLLSIPPKTCLFAQQTVEPREPAFSTRSLQQVTLVSDLVPHLLLDGQALVLEVVAKANEAVLMATSTGDTLSERVRNALGWADIGTKIYVHLKYRKKGESFVRVHSMAIMVSAD